MAEAFHLLSQTERGSFMTSDEIFYRFTQEVRDFIYTNGWESLRPIQVEAANVILALQPSMGRTRCL